MPLAHSLQGAPPWLGEYAQQLAERSRQLGSERYLPFRQVPPERNQAIKSEIDRLIASQKGSKFDIIPFSITGTSKPINVNPNDLRRIIEDEGFARRIYESATGSHTVSSHELEDLRQRAGRKFESSEPEIRAFRELEAQERPIEAREAHALPGPGEQVPLEQDIRRLDEERQPLEQERGRLQERQSEIQNRIKDLKQQSKRITSDFFRLTPQQRVQGSTLIDTGNQYNSLIGEIGSLEPRLREVSDERERIESRLGNMEQQRSNLESQIRSNPLDLFRRSSIEQEINRLQRQTGRIAPMNEIHERAINMLEKSFNDDTMKLASDELRESKRHNELRAVEPLVRSSLEGPSDDYMNKYVNDYTKDIRKALEDESEEEFIKKIAPKINMSFSQMGAFHSGARAKALKDTLLEHRTKLHRELAHLTGGARDKAMEHHELQKRREQSAAHLLGHTTKSEKEAARHQAELLRQQAVTKQVLAQSDVAALGQVAKAKQEQEQHEIDVERQEHERQLLHPQEQLAREAALVHGLPSPPSQTISGQLAPSPMPPNLLNLGAGTLATLASGFQPQRQFKQGGSVRRKYAHGGPIGSDDIGNEIRNIIREQGESDKSRLEHASHHNPVQNWLSHVGKEMLSNPSEDPLLSLGRGTSAAMDHREVMRDRAANLYDKIQETKLNQYQVLAAYENMKDQSALRKEEHALHRENILENRKFHQQQLDNMSKQNIGRNEPSPMVDVSGQEFMPVTSKKEKEELLKEKKGSESILKDLEGIKKLSEDYEKYNKHLLMSPRYPLIGGIASDIQGKYSNITQNKNMRKAAVAKAALDSKLEKFKINMETKMRKGVLPEGMRNFMEKKEVFPSSHEPLDIYNKKLEDLMEETKSVYDASKYSLKHNIHISPYDLETMKSKSSEHAPSNDMMPPVEQGNSWYQQLGGTPSS